MIFRIIEFVRKEFIEIKRDKKTLFALVGFPVLLLVLFTYAAKTDIENLATAVLDFDRTPASRELVNRFINTKYFKVKAEVKSYEELKELIDKGKCFMGLVIPSGFSEELQRRKGYPAKVLLVIDGSIPPTSIQAGNYGKLISAQFFADMTGVKIDEPDAPQKLNLTPIKLQARLLYNPNLDAILFIIPGLIGYLLTFLTVMQSAMAVIREREAGTFDQLLVTPLTSFEIITSKLIPFGLISVSAVVLIMVVSVIWFGMTIEGSILLLGAALLIFIVASLIFGFFISGISKNQVQAAQMTIFYMLPSLILSGMYFPIFSMPKVFQWISYFLPLRYFLVIMRGITLKGVGFKELAPDFFGILGFLMIASIMTLVNVKRKSIS